MPDASDFDCYRHRCDRRRAAEAHVRAKFPHLHPSSTGFLRAVYKRMGIR